MSTSEMKVDQPSDDKKNPEKENLEFSNVPSSSQLTHYQMLVKVRAKMNDLYVALDAFKGALIEDASDLVNQQLAAFSELIPEKKEEEEKKAEVVEEKDEEEGSSVQVLEIEE